MRVCTQTSVIQCGVLALTAVHHVRAFLNAVPQHQSAVRGGRPAQRPGLVPLGVMPIHLLQSPTADTSSWLSLPVGDTPSGITILDRDTEIPTSVNFGGPKPECIQVDPPPEEVLTGVNVRENPGDAARGTFVDLFRGSAPYLRMHRGATFVVHIPGEVLEGPCFQGVMDDIGLLSLLGIQLVLIVGSRPQTNSLMSRQEITSNYCGNLRITDPSTLKVCKEAAGYVRFEVESSLTKGQRGANSINVSGGNFFSAQPIGVRNGIDYGFTGEVRRIETEKITARLAVGDVVQLTSIGFSSSGEVFHVDTEELAAETAAQLGAAKLIYLSEGQQMMDAETGMPVHCLRLREAREILSHFGMNSRPESKALAEQQAQAAAAAAAADSDALPVPDAISAFPVSHPHGERNYTAGLLELVEQSVKALAKGVARAHVVPPSNGALLQELFTRDGCGLLISRDIYDGIRPACASDIPGIFEIIRPLEVAGILVERSRDQLEAELSNFFVFTRDGATIACAYLKRFSTTSAEIGCLAVHPKYRKGGRGEAMLGYLERIAVLSGITDVFVLSTRTMQWFVERGFAECTVADLPESRQALYNWQRKSKVYRKLLAGTREIDAEELFWDIRD